MERMNRHEQIRVLNELLNPKMYEYVGCGSSRLVFRSLRDNTIMKVAVGIGALTQNSAEIKAYADYGEDYPLAAIYRYGGVLEEMERVYVFYDQEGQQKSALALKKHGFEDAARIGNQRHCDRIEYIAGELSDIFGETEDNYQLGVTADGRIVSYDYGFDSNSSRTQIGSAECLSNKTSIANYIKYIIKLLKLKRPLTIHHNVLDSL